MALIIIPPRGYWQTGIFHPMNARRPLRQETGAVEHVADDGSQQMIEGENDHAMSPSKGMRVCDGTIAEVR